MNEPREAYGMRARLERLETPIRVVLAGAGAMGWGLLHQCRITPGFRCVALADVKPERAVACARAVGLPCRVVDSLPALHEAIAAGQLAVCEDADLAARAAPADVFIDATSAIADAARFCTTALAHGKHLIMMNAEADLAFGPFFLREARRQGVVYSSCDGDQHGVIKRLIDDLRLWGFELVMAGNIKGFLNRYADPTSIIPEADKRNLDYRMCTAYTDGTKLAVEMALLANALGLKTAVPGMYGPRAGHVKEVHDLFDLAAIREAHGAVVDYVLGAEPNGGVYAVGYGDDPYQRRMMAYYKMGDGPFYVFYRPYHLCHVEALEAVAAAFLDHRSLLQPDHGIRTDVYAYAKRDLRRGEVLDGIGGYTCYGLLENCDEQAGGIPMCLAEHMTLKRDVARDEKIHLADVSYDPARPDIRLYEEALRRSVPA